MPRTTDAVGNWNDRMQAIIKSKNPDEALDGEGWAVVDGALVIYNGYICPLWLYNILEQRDEDGNTKANTPVVAPDFK